LNRRAGRRGDRPEGNGIGLWALGPAAGSRWLKVPGTLSRHLEQLGEGGETAKAIREIVEKIIQTG